MPQDSPRGTYLEVSESLREKIRDRKITEALPSQSALVSEYGMSRSTIERALAALKAVIESVQGAGWFVAGTGEAIGRTGNRPGARSQTAGRGNGGLSKPPMGRTRAGAVCQNALHITGAPGRAS